MTEFYQILHFYQYIYFDENNYNELYELLNNIDNKITKNTNECVYIWAVFEALKTQFSNDVLWLINETLSYSLDNGNIKRCDIILKYLIEENIITNND